MVHFNTSGALAVNMSYLDNTPFTIVVVEDNTVSGFEAVIYAPVGGSSSLWLGYVNDTGGGPITVGINNTTFANNCCINGVDHPRIWVVRETGLHWRRRGSALYKYLLAHRPRATPTSGEQTGVTTGYIGTPTGTGNAFNPYQGNLAEVLVYNQSLSDVQRTNVQNYLSNKWFTASSGSGAALSNAVTAIFTVAPANSIGTLTATPNPAVPGATVSLTNVVSAVAPATNTPTGTVVFLNNGAPFSTNTLSGGVASTTTASLPHGSNTLTGRQYSGDMNLNPATNGAGLIIDTAPAAPSYTAGDIVNQTLTLSTVKLLLLATDAEGDPVSMVSAANQHQRRLRQLERGFQRHHLRPGAQSRRRRPHQLHPHRRPAHFPGLHPPEHPQQRRFQQPGFHDREQQQLRHAELRGHPDQQLPCAGGQQPGCRAHPVGGFDGQHQPGVHQRDLELHRYEHHGLAPALLPHGLTLTAASALNQPMSRNQSGRLSLTPILTVALLWLGLTALPQRAAAAGSETVNADRWLEIDLYWFEQTDIRGSAEKFWERFAPMFENVQGWKGVILNVGWTVDYVMDWKGNLSAPIPFPAGIKQEPWFVVGGALTGTTDERFAKWKERFAKPADSLKKNYESWTYADLRQLADVLREIAKDNYNIRDMRIGSLCLGWPEVYHGKSGWAKRHPQAYFGGGLNHGYELEADPTAYGAFPKGIPAGTPVYEVFGKQWGSFSKTVGLDAIVLRDSILLPYQYGRSGSCSWTVWPRRKKRRRGASRRAAWCA